jgi:hypothetical protein
VPPGLRPALALRAIEASNIDSNTARFVMWMSPAGKAPGFL